MADSKGEELISRAKAIEALRNGKIEMSPLANLSNAEELTNAIFDDAIDLLAALPVVSSPPNDDLISALRKGIERARLMAWVLYEQVGGESLSDIHNFLASDRKSVV